MYCVYRHTTPSGKVYIGITQQSPNDRWKGGWGYNTNLVFFRAINKYGWDNIKHEILMDGLTKEEAKAAEVRLIAEYRSTEREHGYNITKGGDLGVSRPHTQEEKENARKNWLGEKNPNARAVICLETLEVFGTTKEAALVKNASKVNDCCRRVHKHRTSGGYHWAYYESDKPMSHYEKMLADFVREESKPRVVSERARRLTSERCSVAVKCVETGEVFKSLHAAAEATGANPPNICNCCKGKKKTAAGYHWEYAEVTVDG